MITGHKTVEPTLEWRGKYMFLYGDVPLTKEINGNQDFVWKSCLRLELTVSYDLWINHCLHSHSVTKLQRLCSTTSVYIPLDITSALPQPLDEYRPYILHEAKLGVGNFIVVLHFFFHIGWLLGHDYLGGIGNDLEQIIKHLNLEME